MERGVVVVNKCCCSAVDSVAGFNVAHHGLSTIISRLINDAKYKIEQRKVKNCSTGSLISFPLFFTDFDFFLFSCLKT